MDKQRRERLRDQILGGHLQLRGTWEGNQIIELLDYIDDLEREVQDARAFMKESPWLDQLPPRPLGRLHHQ